MMLNEQPSPALPKGWATPWHGWSPRVCPQGHSSEVWLAGRPRRKHAWMGSFPAELEDSRPSAVQIPKYQQVSPSPGGAEDSSREVDKRGGQWMQEHRHAETHGQTSSVTLREPAGHSPALRQSCPLAPAHLAARHTLTPRSLYIGEKSLRQERQRLKQKQGKSPENSDLKVSHRHDPGESQRKRCMAETAEGVRTPARRENQKKKTHER